MQRFVGILTSTPIETIISETSQKYNEIKHTEDEVERAVLAIMTRKREELIRRIEILGVGRMQFENQTKGHDRFKLQSEENVQAIMKALSDIPGPIDIHATDISTYTLHVPTRYLEEDVKKTCKAMLVLARSSGRSMLDPFHFFWAFYYSVRHNAWGLFEAILWSGVLAYFFDVSEWTGLAWERIPSWKQ